MRRSHIATAVSIVVVTAMVGYLALQRDVLVALRAISPREGVAVVLVAVLGLLVQSQQFRSAIRISEIVMSLRESIALTSANTMANYYLPARGGMLVRAAYMKRVYRFSLAHYGALAVSLTGLTILTAALLGAAGVGIVASTGGDLSRRALVAFVSAGAASVLAVGFVFAIAGRFKEGSRFDRIMQSFRTGMALWFCARGQLVVVLGWTVLLFGAQALRLWLAFRSISVTVGFSSMLVIQAMAAIVFILALTPGNVGLKEGAVVFGASVLGIDPELALLASLIDRAAALIVTFGVGLFSVRYLSMRTTLGNSGISDASGVESRDE